MDILYQIVTLQSEYWDEACLIKCAIISLTPLLFNKTVNGFNSIIEKKTIFLLQLNLLNYIT